MANLIKIDKNGTKYYSEPVKCDRCDGRGEYWWGGMINDRPMYAGVCFKCGGSGKVQGTRKEYTPEYAAKLEAERQAKEQQWAEEQAKREAERKAKEEAERIEREAKEAAELARKAISKFVGTVGDKVDTDLTLDKAAWFNIRNYYGGQDTIYVYTFRDSEGNALVWKTSKDLDLESGVSVHVKGTIKEHSEYKDEKQTVLTRCKVTA